MYAIIETGGKQYKVSQGDIVTVEKLTAQPGDTVTISEVLLVSGDGGVTFGKPYVDGASVSAAVLGGGKGKKIIVYKFKSKKGYHRKKGHRQPFTKIKILEVTV